MTTKRIIDKLGHWCHSWVYTTPRNLVYPIMERRECCICGKTQEREWYDNFETTKKGSADYVKRTKT